MLIRPAREGSGITRRSTSQERLMCRRESVPLVLPLVVPLLSLLLL